MSDASKALHALFARAWDRELEDQPTWASDLGDLRFDDRWPDMSIEAIERRNARHASELDELRKIPRDLLSPRDRTSYDLFERTHSDLLEEHRHRLHLMPMDMRSGPHSSYELADGLPFETIKHYEDWNARLASFPVYLEQNVALMREGMRVGIVQPKIVMQRIPAQLDKELPNDPEHSAFFAPFRRIPSSIAESDRKRLVDMGRDSITKHVLPSLRRLREFVEKEYLPACLDDIGAFRLPDGEAIYAYCARHHTTTSMTPREIHETGLREVARIREAMHAVMKRAHFTGTLSEFFTFLREDPRFYCKTP